MSASRAVVENLRARGSVRALAGEVTGVPFPGALLDELADRIAEELRADLSGHWIREDLLLSSFEAGEPGPGGDGRRRLLQRKVSRHVRIDGSGIGGRDEGAVGP